ncbi:MAG: ATP-binding protein [Thermoguttaceae bacterium]|nr:ATP-binding protein [Thermoguttaceae bacterium]
MQRTAMKSLAAWKEKKRRKPLLITGCRQCGKTWLMTEFGRRCFEKTLLFNFEKEPALSEIFRYDLDPARILRELGMLREGKPIDPERTLIIFDEIQQSPEAVTSIKYFEESGRNLFLLCAGSLLGVELTRKSVSFPVGKAERLALYPLSFCEFVLALGGGNYLEMLRDFDLYREIPAAAAEPMRRYLKLYQVVGGMPEAVQTYLDTNDLRQTDLVLDRIVQDLRNDFSHYAEPVDVLRIASIWDSVPKQMAKENNKFVFSQVKRSARARDLEDALQWLVNAGLVYRLEKVSVPQIPISACADAAFFKVYLNDVGLLRRNARVAYETVLTEPEGFSAFKGAFAENYCMTELTAQGIRPCYWRNKNSAEIDFLFEDGRNRIIPMEVKSAENTKAKSFSVYCKRYAPDLGFKVSAKNIGMNRKGKTREISLPLYLLWKLPAYTAAEE